MRTYVVVLGFVVATLVSACASTSGTNEGYNPYAEPAVVDGVPYKDPGRAQKIRNAFSTYR